MGVADDRQEIQRRSSTTPSPAVIGDEVALITSAQDQAVIAILGARLCALQHHDR